MGADNHVAPCVQGAGDEGGERWGCGLGVGGVGWKWVGWARSGWGGLGVGGGGVDFAYLKFI